MCRQGRRHFGTAPARGLDPCLAQPMAVPTTPDVTDSKADGFTAATLRSEFVRFGVVAFHQGRSIQEPQVTRPNFGTSRWALLGAGCFLGAAFSGCARNQQTTLSQLWDVPPGVPVPADVAPAAPSSQPNDDTPPAPPVAQKTKKSWTERALPDRMLAAFSGRRTPVADPFLGEYPKYDPAAASIADAGRKAELEKQAIPLPGDPPLHVATSVTDAFGNPPDAKRPLSITGAEHQAGANPFNSLDRLKAAIDSDRKVVGVRNGGVDSDQFRRDQVDDLMKQAKQDLVDGRLAAALRSARQAESIATDLKMDFDESEDTPMILVQLIKEKLDTDVSDVTEVPAEESVAFGTAPSVPDFGEPEAKDGDDQAALDSTGRASMNTLMADSGTGSRTSPPFPSDGVELLAPSPEELEVPEPRDVPEPPVAGRRGAMEVATVVGPFSELGERAAQPLQAPRFPAPVDVEQYAEASDASPFLPDTGLSEHTESSQLENVGAGEAERQAESEIVPGAAPRNVAWREMAEPVLRINVKSVPRPLLVAIAIAAVWAAGFASFRIVGLVRSVANRLKG